jgi:hypothetical protein
MRELGLFTLIWRELASIFFQVFKRGRIRDQFQIGRKPLWSVWGLKGHRI